jgi:hypothetical protein
MYVCRTRLCEVIEDEVTAADSPILSSPTRSHDIQLLQSRKKGNRDKVNNLPKTEVYRKIENERKNEE